MNSKFRDLKAHNGSAEFIYILCGRPVRHSLKLIIKAVLSLCAKCVTQTKNPPTLHHYSAHLKQLEVSKNVSIDRWPVLFNCDKIKVERAVMDAPITPTNEDIFYSKLAVIF
jgi:hypothetical protein